MSRLRRGRIQQRADVKVVVRRFRSLREQICCCSADTGTESSFAARPRQAADGLRYQAPKVGRTPLGGEGHGFAAAQYPGSTLERFCPGNLVHGMPAMHNGYTIFSVSHHPDASGGERAVANRPDTTMPSCLGQPEGFCQIIGQRLNFHAQPATNDSPALDDLFHHVQCQRCWDGKADALGAAGLGKDGGIDAYQLAVGINQRASGVALVDGGIGLDEILIGVEAQRCVRWR